MSVMSNDVPDQSQQEQTVLLSHSGIKATCNLVFPHLQWGLWMRTSLVARKWMQEVFLTNHEHRHPAWSERLSCHLYYTSAHICSACLPRPASTHSCKTTKNRWGLGPIPRKADQHAHMWKMCSPEGPLCTALKTRGQNKMCPFPLGITRISTNLCDWLSDPQHFLKVGHSVLRLQTWHWIYHGWVAVALWRMALGTLCSHIKQLSQRMLQLPRK